jgi:hypothetical protein
MRRISHSTLIYCPITGAKHFSIEVICSEKINIQAENLTKKNIENKKTRNRTTNK